MLIAIVLGIPLGPVGGTEAQRRRRPHDHGGLDPRLLAADVLGRPDADHGVLGDAGLAAVERPRRRRRCCSASSRCRSCRVDGLRHLILPATNLALFKLALLIRLTRAGAREALLQDYVKFARAKGLTNARVIGVHVLRNILIPIVTVIGLQFGALIAFAIVTESVFAWPGMGKLLIDSISVLDRPVIVAYLLVIVTLFIVINLRRRRAVLGARSARAADREQGMSAWRACPSRRRGRAPSRRRSGASSRDFLRESGRGVRARRCSASSCSLALFAPLISPQNPYDLAQLDVMDSRLPPGSPAPTGGTFWLGTDDQGRDMLSAIFYGLRISLGVGVVAHGARAASSASRWASPPPTSAAGSRR